MNARNRERGFTLTEMMIVVAIIGVLTTMAIVYMRPKTKPIDVANRFGDLMREGNRRAVALGPVRANVAIALGTTARTRIISTVGPQPTFILQRLEEDSGGAATANWIEIQRYTVNSAVAAESWATAVGSHAALTLITNFSTFTASCYPSGTCDARTLFFQWASGGATLDKEARVSIMPLGGAIYTRVDWN